MHTSMNGFSASIQQYASWHRADGRSSAQQVPWSLLLLNVGLQGSCQSSVLHERLAINICSRLFWDLSCKQSPAEQIGTMLIVTRNCDPLALLQLSFCSNVCIIAMTTPDRSIGRSLSLSMCVRTRKMVNYACEGQSQGKLWWRLVAVLTCKSFVIRFPPLTSNPKSGSTFNPRIYRGCI